MTEEARALVHLGHRVDVSTTDALERDRRVTGPSPSFEDGVAVHRFRNLSNRLAFDQYRFSPIGMRSALREVACDVVHLSEVRHGPRCWPGGRSGAATCPW